jgi:hypothetical protein
VLLEGKAKAAASTDPPAVARLDKNAAQVRLDRWHGKLVAVGIPNVMIATHKTAKGTSTLYSGDGSDATKLFRFLHAFAASGSDVGRSLLAMGNEAAGDPDKRVAEGFLLTLADAAAAALKRASDASTSDSRVEMGGLGHEAAGASEEEGCASPSQPARRPGNVEGSDGDDGSSDVGNIDAPQRLPTTVNALAAAHAAAGKRKRDSAPLRSPTTTEMRGFVNETGVMCWFTALCQALAASYWVLRTISVSLPVRRPGKPTAGDALVEGIQRCCNNRGVRPDGTRAEFRFAVSERSVPALSAFVLSRLEEHDPADAINSARKSPGASSLGDLLLTITSYDVTWFTVPHAQTCCDSKKRSWYRPAYVQAIARGQVHPPIFVVSPQDIEATNACPAAIALDEIGLASYFTDSDGATALSSPGILARYLNTLMMLPDQKSNCPNCSTTFCVSGRRRLARPPNVLIIFVQREPGDLIPAPSRLFLNNYGKHEDTVGLGRPIDYACVAVIHRIVAPRHFTANVRTQSGAFLLCDDASITGATNFGDHSTAYGFVYDRLH